MYVYIQTEPMLWTVGFHEPCGRWESESDYASKEEAAERVAYLNGQGAVASVLGEVLNSGDGVYRP